MVNSFSPCDDMLTVDFKSKYAVDRLVKTKIIVVHKPDRNLVTPSSERIFGRRATSAHKSVVRCFTYTHLYQLSFGFQFPPMQQHGFLIN